jgi:hypothetical protein
MKRRVLGAVLITGLVLALMTGCSSPPDPDPVDPAPTMESPPAESPSVDPEPEVEAEAPPEAEPEPEAVSEPEPEPEPEPDPVSEPAPPEVSEELYEQTFTEVEQTIQELNDIISRRDYVAWQGYLTEDYRRTYSSPEVLAESSQSAVLVRNNIRLETLEDYFNFVVVPSRANVRLDDLVFVDEQTVEAIMEIRGDRYLLYLLKKVDNRWKIDTF